MENETHTIQETAVQQAPMPELSDKQMLAEILDNTRKTKNYMKWQLIITVALVVVPLIGALIMIPIVLNSLSGLYGGALEGASAASELQDLLK